MFDFLDTENGETASLPSPKICIVLLTYLRTQLAVRTIQSVKKNLDYPNRVWYIADDGSPIEHMQKIFEALEGESIYTYHNESFSQRPFCGKGWNRALDKSHTMSDFVLWLEDDWELSVPLDLRPYVRVMLDRQDVGMVTFRGISIGLRAEAEGDRGIHYWKILRDSKMGCMAYSGNPLLRHVRFLQTYGSFSVVDTPGDIEIAYDNVFRWKSFGPDIWRPAGMNPWGIWGHIGEARTW